uniref:C-type lectin domain-containing protein n=1 Tax=Myripristis murdjan TaxID=586833 RepID=A0A668AGT7_9TELE
MQHRSFVPTATSVSATSERKNPFRAAAVFLVLLCLLLLAAIITLAVLSEFSQFSLVIAIIYCPNQSCQMINHEPLTCWSPAMAAVQLQEDNTNLTKEKKKLQTSFSNLTEERNQLQTSYNNLTEERNQLQTSYNNLTEERNQLQTKKLQLQAEIKGLEEFSSSCYFISSESKNWDESRQDCLRRGADLVIINSREEQVRHGLGEFRWQLKKLTWIGLTDSETEGIWKWVDGTPLTTSYWGPGEPNSDGGKNEDCGEIRFHDRRNRWNDESCGSSNFWICEKPSDP